MLEPFSNHAERQRLNAGLRFILGRAIGQDARQIGNLSDPAAVCLALKLNLERQLSLRQAILPAWRDTRKAAPPVSLPAPWTFLVAGLFLKTLT